MRRFTWICALHVVAAALPLTAVNADDLEDAFDSGTIIIEATEDACYRFDVYLAIDREQQIRGLMNVRALPEFWGMLFIYESPDMRSMWMKNTYISLDILFIREDGSIASIETHTEPLSLTSITSSEPVSYVLELNAGVTERLHIGTGSRVHL